MPGPNPDNPVQDFPGLSLFGKPGFPWIEKVVSFQKNDPEKWI